MNNNKLGLFGDSPMISYSLCPPPVHRIICTTPEKILDAPDLKDDFYINPLT